MAKSMEKLNFRVKYSGQLQQIDSNTLINSLIHLNTILQEINEELNREHHIESKLEVKVNAFTGGSFLVELGLLKDIEPSLLATVASIQFTDLKHLISILAELLKLSLHLKGRKPKKTEEDGNKISVQNNNGAILQFNRPTVNLYGGNFIANEALKKHFEPLKDDPAIEGFSLTDESEVPYIEIPKDGFSDLTQANELLEETIQRDVVSDAILYIVKLAFEEQLKWQFYYLGNKISATIKDEKFIRKIKKGEPFRDGDMLICRLEIEKVLDPNVNVFVNRSFKIIEVLSHKPRDEQSSLSV